MTEWRENEIASSPIIKWVLSPFIILTMIIVASLGLTSDSEGATVFITLGGMEVFLLLLLLVLWLPFRYAIGVARVVTLMVAILYIAYLVSELIEDTGSLYDAIQGFALYALPCLSFTIFGGKICKNDAVEDDDCD